MHLLKAQEKQKKYVDQHRRHLEFEAGQQVYISTTDLPLKGPRRLAPKWFGPVTIIGKISPLNYQLALPDAWKRKHPVFHISKLKPYHVSAKFPGRNEIRPPPDLELGSDIYNVESMLDRRATRSGRSYKIEYLIKWEGYPLHEATWESKRNLTDAGTEVKRMMQEIDATHPTNTINTTTTTTTAPEPPEPDTQEMTPDPQAPGPANKYNLRSKILTVADATALSIDFFSY
jgi:hypothetical protein